MCFINRKYVTTRIALYIAYHNNIERIKKKHIEEKEVVIVE